MLRLNLISKLAAALGFLLLAAASSVAPASAQDDLGGMSYITPFPDKDVYRVQVFGDWIAEGLLSGLTEALSGDARLQLPRKHHSLSGLIRFESDDFANFEETIGRDPPQIAVVLIGMSDRVSLRAQNWRRVVVGSDEWKAEYGRRVDRFMKALKKRNAAIYWVGLPIVRRPDWSSDLQMINDIIRERALQNNVKYIDV